MSLTISQSKIKSWRRCRNAYHYRYVERIEPKRQAKPLYRGTLVHECLEEDIKGKDIFSPLRKARVQINRKQWHQDTKQPYLDIVSGLARTMRAYKEWYGDDGLEFLTLNKRPAEFYFRTRLASELYIEGEADAIVQTPDNRLWLMEHKSHDQLPLGDFKFTDIQTVLYAWALPRAGYPKVTGVMWNYIRGKPPVLPEVLKSGKITKRSNIDTVWPIYKQAVLNNGQSLKDYRAMKKQLANAEKKFFVRIKQPLSRIAHKTIVDDAVTTGREIEKLAGSDRTRSIERHCEWCDYRTLCRFEMLKLDTEELRKVEFQYAEDKEKKTAEGKRHFRAYKASVRTGTGNQRSSVRKKRNRKNNLSRNVP